MLNDNFNHICMIDPF